jgi:cell filamentation protein, protein adenylyltransferase
MRADRFVDSPFGHATRRPGDKWAFDYYLPRPVPRQLSLDDATVLALSEADSALGLLNGPGRLITPEVLLGPFIAREALASSRIEGTKASLSEILQAEGAAEESPKSDDVEEVGRYLSATRRGLQLISELPITQRLITEVHATLLQGVRGEEKLPGELRRTPVWVGSADATPGNARFVPPLSEHLPNLLSDWERFVNEPPQMPALIRCALMHYQFEIIHPFLDSNGRIGRLLIGLMIIVENRLSRPLLYLSGYLEANKDEYYDRLQGVREKAEIQEYLQFFLLAVRRQSDDAVDRAGRLVELREKYYSSVQLDRSRVAGLIPLIFSTPFLTVKRIQRAMHVTPQGARKLLLRTEEYGWLRHSGTLGRGGLNLWLAHEVFEVIESPLNYL